MRKDLSSRMKLTDLNIDCLLGIFKYLPEHDLVSLCEACNYFNAIIEDYIFYGMSKDLLLCGHRNSPLIEQRNHTRLTYLRRLQISQNWLTGNYMVRIYFPNCRMITCKLWLDSDALYITYGNYLRKYRRISGEEPLQRHYEEEISRSTTSDVTDFVKKKDIIFAGHFCGTCFIKDVDGITEQRMHHANERLCCVDFVDDVFATSTDVYCKLWKRSKEFGLTYFDLFAQLKTAFKSMKLSANGQWLFGGKSSDSSGRALRVIHVDSGAEMVLNSQTVSIYDLKIKDDQTLFTANSESTFRMFDRRSDGDVAVWEDPLHSSTYCLDYDGLYAVLCGARTHSRISLYDIRVPNKCIQRYLATRPKSTQLYGSSPVYSLVCDSQYAFIAANPHLRVFDFSIFNNGVTRDYTHYLDQTAKSA